MAIEAITKIHTQKLLSLVSLEPPSRQDPSNSAKPIYSDFSQSLCNIPSFLIGSHHRLQEQQSLRGQTSTINTLNWGQLSLMVRLHPETGMIILKEWDWVSQAIIVVRASCDKLLEPELHTMINQITPWAGLLNYVPLSTTPILPLFRHRGHVSTPYTNLGFFSMHVLIKWSFSVSLTFISGTLDWWLSFACWSYWSMDFYSKTPVTIWAGLLLGWRSYIYRWDDICDQGQPSGGASHWRWGLQSWKMETQHQGKKGKGFKYRVINTETTSTYLLCWDMGSTQVTASLREQRLVGSRGTSPCLSLQATLLSRKIVSTLPYPTPAAP